MRLFGNEMRARAARSADEWQDTAYEKGETQSLEGGPNNQSDLWPMLT